MHTRDLNVPGAAAPLGSPSHLRAPHLGGASAAPPVPICEDDTEYDTWRRSLDAQPECCWHTGGYVWVRRCGACGAEIGSHDEGSDDGATP